MRDTKTDRYTDEHIISSEEREKPRRRTQTTRDHELIRRWAEDRGAQPASSVRSQNTGIGVLRLDIPGETGRALKRIDWNDWFQAFDDRDLCFVYQEKSEDGRRSDFFRLELSG